MKKFTMLILFALMIAFFLSNFASAEEQCIPSNPSITILPVNQTVFSGSILSYTINLKNNDNSYCSNTDFRLRCEATYPTSCFLVSSGGSETNNMIEGNMPPDFNWTRVVKVYASSTNISLGFSYPFIVTIDDGAFEKSVTKSNSVTGYYTTPSLSIRCVDYDNSPDFLSPGFSYSNMNTTNYPSLYTKSYGIGVYAGASLNNHQIYGQEPDPLTAKPTTNRYSTFYDHCANDNQLNEAFCMSDGRLGAHGLNCPYGCRDGACLTSPTNTTCTDSDGGKNYYVQGTITSGTTQLVESCYLFNSDGSGSPVNECSSSDSRCKIHEHWCEGSTIKAEEYKCLYGCSNGACVKSTNNAYIVTIQASDPSDSYLRDWNIFTYDPTGTYIGNGKWSSGTPLKTSYYTRSGTWSVNLNSGTYYLVIGQTGGESYGTYSGEISINGVSMHFTNADINHAIKFNVPLQGNTSNKCVNHDECSQACDNLGIDFHWMGTGSSYRSWNGVCPSTVYGCMTGQCCIGQCRYTTTNDCTCVRTNKVDIYGDACPVGQTCGSDCYCHSTSGDEYKTVNLKETFYLSASSFSPYKWEIKSYDKNYLENKISGVGCGSNGECTYTFQFTALKEGKTVVELNKINTNDNSVVEVKRFYVTIIGGTDTIQIVYLNKPFNMNEGGKAEVVDYRNMRIKLNKIVIAAPTTGGGSSSSITGGIITSSSGGGSSTAYISDKFAVIEVSLAEYSSSTGVTSLLTLYEGETKSIFGAYIKLQKIDLTTRTATFLVTLQTADFNFRTVIDKGTYIVGETVKISAILSGSSSFNFGNAKVEIKLKDPKGNVIDLPVKSTGIIASECSISTTTNAYTCPVLNQYSYYAYYTIPSDATLGYYSISSKATLESIEKYAYNSFNVDNVYSELVGVEINPKKISTVIGETATYKITITDKHPLMKCIVPIAESSSTTTAASTQVINQTTTEPITKCGTQIYNYLISVDGLPYHSVYPNVASVQAGESKTFELKVFPSPTKTAQGITTAVKKAEPTPSEERTISISGKPIATETKAVIVETSPINEAVFKFTVKASLREEPSVSNSDTGFLHVKFIQDPEPPPFPEEKIDIELKKGWNLVSVPGKGAGFVQGSCLAESKPVAFIYLLDQRKYINIDEALGIMGREKLLEYISTRSFWIYSPEECKIGFKFETYSTYSGLEINKGWNLIGTTKDMVGETLSTIKGTCNFEKIYVWDAISRKWVERSESDLIEKMGYGILIKSNSTCILKTNIIQPPSFPEE